MKRQGVIGYTTGVFDLFHIGHLNILKNAKSQCDYLIVGITSDQLTEELKTRRPVVPLNERIEIVKSIIYVDEVIVQNKIDEINDYQKLQFNVIFKGSDWEGTKKWKGLEIEFAKLGVKVVYFPYTLSTSSSILRKVIEKMS